MPGSHNAQAFAGNALPNAFGVGLTWDLKTRSRPAPVLRSAYRRKPG